MFDIQEYQTCRKCNSNKLEFSYSGLYSNDYIIISKIVPNIHLDYYIECIEYDRNGIPLWLELNIDDFMKIEKKLDKYYKYK